MWLYCFSCGSSHYFSQLAGGSWMCPNCHAVRHIYPTSEPDEEPDGNVRQIQCTTCGKWFCTGTYTKKCFDCLKKQEVQ